MLALSIRQPFAKLILRGVKTVEYRTRACRMLGERFWIYASKSETKRHRDGETKWAWSYDLSMSDPPEWMIELAEQVKLIEPGALLPRGVIVGSAVIERVSRVDSMYRWHLTDVERARRLRKPSGRPQPVWFKPF